MTRPPALSTAPGVVSPLPVQADWANSSVGPVEEWSEALLSAVGLVTGTRFPVALMWGADFTLIYNEAYAPLIGDKHPAALGRPAREVFAEAWDLIGPLLHGVRQGHGATWVEDASVPLDRHGFLEDCYFTFSFSPVVDQDGTVEGVMDIATETTGQVVSRRRLDLLRRLGERLADLTDPADVVDAVVPLLRAERADFPTVELAAADTPASCEPHETVRLEVSSPGASEGLVLTVGMEDQQRADPHHRDYLRLVAATVRQALDRVRVRSAERALAQTMLTMSEAFQRSLLPRPTASGVAEVAVRYQPALEVTQVGGDWYDVFDLPDGSQAVVIGDVSGHDHQAAATMAMLRNLLRGVALARHPGRPAEVLTALDCAVALSEPEVVATVVLAHIDATADGSVLFRWSNAGHPSPVLIDTDGTARLLDTEADLLLGLDSSLPRQDHQVVLAPGAAVVLYTDGLVERREAPLSAGLAWLVDELTGQAETSVESVADRLLAAIGAVEDDVALLVLRAAAAPG